MDQTERDILISNRVELVENLDMTGGLFTHLLARKILNQRKVNEFKLQRTPEAQAEELLSYLPKRDCFRSFCEALQADGQDDIVEKYLKIPSKKTDPKENPADSNINTQDLTSSSSVHRNEEVTAECADRETPDCAIPSKKRTIYPHHPSPPAVLCIKESDEKHVYIKYNNPPSPAKRPKTHTDCNGSAVMIPYDIDDNTRYALKHYVSNEDEAADNGNKSVVLHPKYASTHAQFMVLPNVQSISENANISDPSRYASAFRRQPAEKPYEDSVSLQSSDPSIKSLSSSHLMKRASFNENTITSAYIDKHDSQDDLHCSGKNSVFQTNRQNKNGHEVSEVKKPMSFSCKTALSGNVQYLDPQQYLQETGTLPSKRGVFSAENYTKGLDSWSTNNGDSVDTMAPQNNFGFNYTEGGIEKHLQLDYKSLEVENQELEIDLPDGCVNVKVEHSTRQFFLNNFKKSYPMRQIPRGLALVINVDEVEGKPPRKGTNFDRDNLCNLLTQLHFNIVVYNDNDGLSAQEMVNKLKAFAKLRDHHNYDACFICLLSHGEEGYIFGTDGKRIPLEEIFMLFGNTNCKGLIGKPKVFIIQACRGGTLDKGVRMDEPDGGSLPAKAPPIQQLPSMSDMLICYPTLMGYYAWRNRARGSWYIEAIVQVFMRYAKNEDICAMLNRVNQVVSKKVSECNQKEMNQMSQMSEYKSTLRQPHLYLFPGIGCSGM